MSKFASLTAGLLARKGEAEPTSTPFADQLLTRVGAPAADIRALTPMPQTNVHVHAEPGAAKQQGFKASPPDKAAEPATSILSVFGRRSAETPRHEIEVFKPTLVPAVVHEEGGDNCPACPGATAEDPTKTFHVNLRLKRQRFVKLKLSAALLRRPVQDIVSEALDEWFDKLPSDVLGDCSCMKARD